MPRNHRIQPTIDLVAANASLIREYAESGETYLGTHPRARLQSLQGRLQALKNYTYHQLATNNDPDSICACVWLVLQHAELDYDTPPEACAQTLTIERANERTVRFYWRHDRIMRAREREGLAVNRLSPEQQTDLAEAKKSILDNL